LVAQDVVQTCVNLILPGAELLKLVDKGNTAREHASKAANQASATKSAVLTRCANNNETIARAEIDKCDAKFNGALDLYLRAVELLGRTSAGECFLGCTPVFGTVLGLCKQRLEEVIKLFEESTKG
jgi:hypothetical protein